MRKLAVLGLLMLAGAAAAQSPDPREHNFTFSVDGAGITGVIGYRIEFAQNPAATRGSRRLDLPYLPTQRALFITVTSRLPSATRSRSLPRTMPAARWLPGS
jgi:hypothetical protein